MSKSSITEVNGSLRFVMKVSLRDTEAVSVYCVAAGLIISLSLDWMNEVLAVPFLSSSFRLLRFDNLSWKVFVIPFLSEVSTNRLGYWRSVAATRYRLAFSILSARSANLELRLTTLSYLVGSSSKTLLKYLPSFSRSIASF